MKGYRITLEITEGQVGGTAACNSYGGPVHVDADSFALKEGLRMTEMGCEPRVMESEAAYVDALSAVHTIARDGDTLALTGRDTKLHFELVPPPPIAQLSETLWQLDSLVQGAGPRGTAMSAAPARLLLRSDGKLSGSTGCRDFEGRWVERGDEVLFTRLTAEGRCPPELQQQDGHVLGVLGDGFTTEVEGRELLLFSKGGLGLHYRADSKG